MTTGQKAEYRSAIRSRKLIRQALYELIREKELEKITVTDIVNRADINRRTFYAHYADVRALIGQIENETIENITDLLNSGKSESFILDPLPQLLKVSSHLEPNLEFYGTLVNSSLAEPFMTKLKSIFVSFMQSDVDIPPMIKATSEYAIFSNFVAGGIANILQIWFRGDMEQSLEELFTSVARLMKTPLPAGQSIVEGLKDITIE